VVVKLFSGTYTSQLNSSGDSKIKKITNLNSQYHLFTIFVSLPLATEYQIMVGCSFVVLSSLLHFAAATSFLFAVDAVVDDFFSIVVAVVDLFLVINLLCSFLGEM